MIMLREENKMMMMKKNSNNGKYKTNEVHIQMYELKWKEKFCSFCFAHGQSQWFLGVFGIVAHQHSTGHAI